MSIEIIDTVVSLVAIVEEENDKLASPGPHRDLAELVNAKARLVGTLSTQLATIARNCPGWMEEMDQNTRTRFTASIQVLRDASIVNAAALERHLNLSTEMMACVAAEAQRLIGARNATYGAQGCLSRIDLSAPISVNTSL